MPITGKEIVIPEQVTSSYWLEYLNVETYKTTDAPRLRAGLRPYIVVDGSPKFVGERIEINVANLNQIAAQKPDVALAIQKVFEAIQGIAKDQNLI